MRPRPRSNGETLEAIEAAEWLRLNQLRFQLLELHPFWGHLLLQVRVAMAPSLDAFGATDCVRTIWLNPRHTRHLTLRQLGFVLVHELGHILLLSGDRRAGRDPHLWNCATDYAINRMVASIRHPELPRPLYESPNGTYPELGDVEILHKPRWDRHVAETIYERLAADELREGRRVTVTLSGSEGRGEQRDADGSTDIPGVWDHRGGIDIHLPQGLSPDERDEVLDRIGGALTAWRAQGRRGDAPGEAIRLLEEDSGSRIGWRALLQRHLRSQFDRQEWNLRRPDRRRLEMGLWSPTLHREEQGEIVVALDSSGSMSTGLLGRFVSRLASLAEVCPEVTLIVADSKVQEVISPGRLHAFLARRTVKGGGGTDHRPVFDWIRQKGLRPDLFVGITDLYSRFPKKPPPFPVLWLTPVRHGSAPWGRLIPTDIH